MTQTKTFKFESVRSASSLILCARLTTVQLVLNHLSVCFSSFGQLYSVIHFSVNCLNVKHKLCMRAYVQVNSNKVHLEYDMYLNGLLSIGL